MTRKQRVQAAYVELLMDKVRNDNYPSATHLRLIEDAIPPPMVPDYLDLLMRKASQDTQPSIPMLHRIKRVADEML
jgi:hypothetical protein